MSTNICLGILLLASLFSVCVFCLDEDLFDIGSQPPVDSSQYSNEVQWISQSSRPRRDSSEVREGYRFNNRNLGHFRPHQNQFPKQFSKSNMNPNPEFMGYYEKIDPNSGFVIALKKKRFMGIELAEFISKQNRNGIPLELDADGQPDGQVKSKLTSFG